jgi:hypothetical protein
MKEPQDDASPAALEAEGHNLIARGHELLRRAATARAAPALPTSLLPIQECARLAATSVRVVRDAIRAGDLTAYGGQRDRAVRADDLARWIESRRVILSGPADADIERRMQRLGRRRGARAA